MRPSTTKIILSATLIFETAICSTRACADFIINIDPGTVSGGLTQYTVRAFNNGLHGSGTKLAAFDMTITTPGTGAAGDLKVNLADLDGDGALDANIAGSGLSFGSTAGTFGRAGVLNALDNAFPQPFMTDPAGTGHPTQSINSQYYGGLHSLELQDLSTSGGAVANTGAGTPFLNIVVPTGTPFSLTGRLISETDYSGPIPAPPPPNPIISLTAASAGIPSYFFGSSFGTLNLSGHDGNYGLAQITNIQSNPGYVEVKSFNPASDPELFALQILWARNYSSAITPATPAQINALVSEINGEYGSVGGVIASATSPSGAFPSNYNLFISVASPASGDNYLGINLLPNGFASEYPIFTAIAAIPEPSSLAVLFSGSVSLFGWGRRSKKNHNAQFVP